jgi:hypothetical protein
LAVERIEGLSEAAVNRHEKIADPLSLALRALDIMFVGL